MDANVVILVGRLTRDPEMKTFGETKITKFVLATGRKFKGEEKTTFVDVTCFGKMAEFVAEYMRKGSLLFVQGRLEYQTWEAKDGTKRNKLEVIAEQVSFGPKSSDAQEREAIREEISEAEFRQRLASKGDGIPF